MLCPCSAQRLVRTQRWVDTAPRAGPGGGTHRSSLSLGDPQPCHPLLDPLPKAKTWLPPASKPVAELWFLLSVP